jgi:phage gp36-like protein
MPYAAITDMIQAFGEAELITVTTPEGMERASIDQAMVTAALTTASDEMDSYLRRRYAVPVAQPSAKMTSVCCDMARWLLWKKPTMSPSDAMRADRKDAIAWLAAINDGRVTLDGAIALNVGTDFSQIQTRRPAIGGGFL